MPMYMVSPLFVPAPPETYPPDRRSNSYRRERIL
jgi:hypothetical protein